MDLGPKYLPYSYVIVNNLKATCYSRALVLKIILSKTVKAERNGVAVLVVCCQDTFGKHNGEVNDL